MEKYWGFYSGRRKSHAGRFSGGIENTHKNIRTNVKNIQLKCRIMVDFGSRIGYGIRG